MCGLLFFYCFKCIFKVIILLSWVDIYVFFGVVKFVVIVIGIVGWEVICCGMFVLIFGNVWYCKLSGVVEFIENVIYDEIVFIEIDYEVF